MLTPRKVESGVFSGLYYGYLWWIVQPERMIYAAIGNSGNVIYVDPNKRIVALCLHTLSRLCVTEWSLLKAYCCP